MTPNRRPPISSPFSEKPPRSFGGTEWLRFPGSAGLTRSQVLAANIDVVFMVQGLDGDFNLRRLERTVAASMDERAHAYDRALIDRFWL